jgi:hypothetical protein
LLTCALKVWKTNPLCGAWQPMELPTSLSIWLRATSHVSTIARFKSVGSR